MKKLGEVAGFKEAWVKEGRSCSSAARWFRHIERLEGKRFVRRLDAKSNRDKGRLKRRWMYRIKDCLYGKGLKSNYSKARGDIRRWRCITGDGVDDPKWSCYSPHPSLSQIFHPQFFNSLCPNHLRTTPSLFHFPLTIKVLVTF